MYIYIQQGLKRKIINHQKKREKSCIIRNTRETMHRAHTQEFQWGSVLYLNGTDRDFRIRRRRRKWRKRDKSKKRRRTCNPDSLGHAQVRMEHRERDRGKGKQERAYI